MRYYRNLVNLPDLFSSIFFIRHLSLGTAYFCLLLYTTLLLSINLSTLPPLTLQDTSSILPLVTGWTTKGIYFHWLTNLKFLENKPTTLPKVTNFSSKQNHKFRKHKAEQNFQIPSPHTSGGTWVRARGLKDRNPFRQWVVQQATYVRLQPLDLPPPGNFYTL